MHLRRHIGDNLLFHCQTGGAAECRGRQVVSTYAGIAPWAQNQRHGQVMAPVRAVEPKHGAVSKRQFALNMALGLVVAMMMASAGANAVSNAAQGQNCSIYSSEEQVGTSDSSCFPLNTGQRTRIAEMLRKICPSVAYLYGKAPGVYLRISTRKSIMCKNSSNSSNNVDSVDNNQLPSALEEYLTEMNSSRELSYLAEVEKKVHRLMASLYWYNIDFKAVERRMDALICTSMLPFCQWEGAALRLLRPCEWLCADPRDALLPLGNKLLELSRRSNQSLKNSSLYKLVTRIASSCSSQLPCMTCSDLLCGTFVQYTKANHTSFRNSTKHTEEDFLEPRKRPTVDLPSLCYNKHNPCHGPFVPTGREHWFPLVQDYLKGSVGLLHLLLNVTEQELPVDGRALPCSLTCGGVLFSSKQKDAVQRVMVPALHITAIACIFALLSFLMQWKRLKLYPTIILLFLNSTTLCTTLAILIPWYITKAGSDIILCHADKSLRITAPSGGDSGGCATLFSLGYFFFVASALWWSCLAHSWFVTFRSLENPKRAATIKEQSLYMKAYHFITWPIACALTIIALATKSVAGAPVYGICWLKTGAAHRNLQVIPVALIICSGCVFLCMGLYKLLVAWESIVQMWHSGAAAPRRQSRRKVKQNTVQYTMRMLAFVVVALVLNLAQIITSVYQNEETEEWYSRVQSYAACILSTCETDQGGCPEAPHFSAANLLIGRIIALSLFGIWAALWAVLSPRVWKSWRGLSSRAVTSAKRSFQRSISSLTIASSAGISQIQSGNLSSAKWSTQV